MEYMIRYLSLVVKIVAATLIWAGLFITVARADSSFEQVKESLWTMGVEKVSVESFGDETETLAADTQQKDIPEELSKALETL